MDNAAGSSSHDVNASELHASSHKADHLNLMNRDKERAAKTSNNERSDYDVQRPH